MDDINLTEEEFSDLENYIYYSLGGSLIEVELEQEHYEHAFKEARRMYLSKGNVTQKHRFIAFPLEQNKQEYVFTEELHVPIRIIRFRSSIFNKEDPFHQAIVSDIFKQVGRGNHHIFNYELSLMLIKDINYAMCHDISFRFNKKNNTIFIDQAPRSNESALLECYLTPDDNELVEHYWIRDWALSVCEIALGRAYSKFSEVRTPTGTSQLPGNDLIQSGKDRQKELLDDLTDGWIDQQDNPQAGFILKG